MESKSDDADDADGDDTRTVSHRGLSQRKTASKRNSLGGG